MNEDVILNDQNEHANRGFVIGARGLRVLRDLTHDEWTMLGRIIVARVEGGAWALGDWLIEGARDERSWLGGSQYEVAAQITGYSKTHLSNAYRVAVAFPPKTRRMTLSWSVHREIVRLSEELRDVALIQGEAEKWTHEEAQAYVDAKIAEHRGHDVRPRVSTASSREFYRSPHVRCPNCQHEFPIKGNKVSQLAAKTA